MAQSKYKRHSRGGRFRQQGEGSRAAVDEIRRQRQTEIDALKTQALQQKERDSLQISGLRNVAKNEAENREILHKLENEIYQTKRNAITVRSQTEVDALLGQAKELGREAEFWEEFATKHSQNYAKLATGIYDYAQYRSAINAYESMSDDQKNLAVASYEGNYDIVENEMGESIVQIKSLKDRKDLITSTVGRFANNRYLHKMLANDYIQTNKATQDLLRSATTPDGKALYNKDTAAAMTMNKAYNFIHSHGIPLNSEAAQKILSNAKQTAVVETTSLTKSDNYKTDQLDIQEHLRMVKDSLVDINRVATKPYKNKYGASISGRISGQEEFNDSLYLLYHVIEGSHILGANNTIIAPGDPSRQAETPKQKWARVLNMVAEGLDFKTVADGIDTLNIPVRNMKTGKVILNKKGKPAEFILDKHLDLKTDLIQLLKQKQNNSITKREQKIRTDQVATASKFEEEIQNDFDKGDFSNTFGNKDWMVKMTQWSLDPANKNAPEAKRFLDLAGQSPTLFGDDYDKNINLSLKLTEIDQEYLSGDVNGAAFTYVMLGKNLPKYAHHEALVSANKMPGFSTNVKKAITAAFKENLGAGIMETQIANKEDLEKMIEKGVGRFMVVWATNGGMKPDGKTPLFTDLTARFEATKDVVAAEIQDGLKNQKGWAAASENLQAGDLTAGWKFAAISNKTIAGGELLSDKDVGELFTVWDTDYDTKQKNLSFSEYRGQRNINQDVLNKTRINDVMKANFNKLVTKEDAYRLLNDISTGQAATDKIPKNLYTFIRVSQLNKYNVTTREIMNMAISHIKMNGDSIWTNDTSIDSQFKDYEYEWPASKDDLVKVTSGVVSCNPKNNTPIMACEYLKRKGIDINDVIIQRVKRELEDEYGR